VICSFAYSKWRLKENLDFNIYLNGKLSVSMGQTIFQDIKSNYAPVWTISQNITAVPWKLKVPTQFQILKCKRHSKALRRSEKMHLARFLRPESTFLTIPILVAGVMLYFEPHGKLTRGQFTYDILTPGSIFHMVFWPWGQFFVVIFWTTSW
jgi:hypothetical protein